MEFRRIRIGAFGTLRDLDSGPEPLTRLVVVLGPNEAGKSTLFHFLTSILYGIYPASRDRNPYTPWGGGDIEGGAVLRLGDGGELDVHRRLLSSPTGTVTRGEVSEDIRNHTLPCAEHVPREVFRQVFALGLDELVALEGESWERVQDRLVTGMGASDLASARVVADELEREAGRLWRPTRMGNQAIRDLRERLRELRLRRRAASDVDRRLRDAARERAKLAAELREARREREACHLYVERCQTLLPLRERLRRIDELREEAGPPEELEGLPADPEARLAELDAGLRSVDERLEAVEAEAAEAQSVVAAFGDAEQAVLDRATGVRDALSRVAALEPLRVRHGQLQQEIRDLDRRCRDTARELLEAPWSEVDEDAVLAVPVSRLREGVARYRDARESRRLAEAAARDDTGPGARRPPLPAALAPALAALGAAALAGGLGTGRTVLAVGGALLAGVGAALTVVHRWTAPTPGTAARSRESRLAGARADEEEARAAVVALLSELPARTALLEHPPAELATRLQRLQELVGDLRDRREQLAEIRDRLRDAGDSLDTLARELGVEPGSESAVTAHRLEARLQDARAARDAADTARSRLEKLQREREDLSMEAAGVRARREELRRRLSALTRPEEDGLWAAETVRARLDARDRGRRLREELEREHPDVEELRRRIRRVEESGAGWSLDAETLVERKARERELADRIEELARRLEGLEKDMDYLRREDTVGAVEGEMETIQARIEAATRTRDRLWALAALLREADRRFREEHQPDILRRAGCHLSVITGGRYGKILLDEGAEGRFLLEGPGYPGPVAVGEPVSRGTREQVYLALRMAILDHLDRNGERLPVFMDEAFVNWDETRRERGFGLLDELARTRQVFAFTCHEALAGSLAARGARVLALDAPS